MIVMIKPLKLGVASGKHTKNYGKSQFWRSKSTINCHVFFDSLPDITPRSLRLLICYRMKSIYPVKINQKYHEISINHDFFASFNPMFPYFWLNSHVFWVIATIFPSICLLEVWGCHELQYTTQTPSTRQGLWAWGITRWGPPKQ